MEFEKLWENVRPGNIVSNQNLNFPWGIESRYMKTGTQDKCCVCGNLTTFMEINLVKMVCSQGCDEQIFINQNEEMWKNLPWYKKIFFWFKRYI